MPEPVIMVELMASATSDSVLLLTKDSWFEEQFPSVPEGMRFSDTQSLYRFLDTNEKRLMIILDGRPEGYPGWSSNHLVIVFHDYSSGGISDVYDAGDVQMAFNRDDDGAIEIVNQIIDHLIV